VLGEIQEIKCPTVSIIFLAQPRYLGAFALRAKATAGHFITGKGLGRLMKTEKFFAQKFLSFH
jgi:hypothetical protein